MAIKVPVNMILEAGTYILDSSTNKEYPNISLMNNNTTIATTTNHEGKITFTLEENTTITQLFIFYANNISYNYDVLKPKLKKRIKSNGLIFSGVVKNTGDMSLNPREPHYANLQVLDFKTMLSEGDILNFVIDNKTVPQAIEMVVDAVSNYGIEVGNIEILNPDEIIGAYSTVDKTAYDVLQYLAEVSQARWTTRLIDENTIAVDFYDPTLMEQANDIEYTKEYFEANNIESIEYNYGTYDYRNKQVMNSDQVYGSIDYVETILADGYNRNFMTNANIGVIKSIYIDGVAQTFGTNDDKEIGMDYNFYYTPGQNQIEQNENDTIISSNSSIVITYTPLIKGRQIIYNTDEVNRISRQTGRNGVISRYENRNDVLSSDELIKIGETYIKYKGSAEINLIVKTYNYNLFNVGQLVYFNAPLDELKQQYMVKQKTTTMYVAKNQQNIFIEYTLTSSFNSEREVNYFDNQRNKTKGNISAGEYITRNVDIENTANIIFNNLTVEEIIVDGDNILNSVLNSPFNN
jgi:hypothetical protein